MDRRYFLGSAISAGVAFRASALASPNDTVRVAQVGFRSRGKDHLEAYLQMPNVEVAAVCDIDETVLNAQLSAIEKAKGKRPAGYTDLRKLLEDKSIDAISIATPNHNHTLQTVWACQAGKDVYVEKPCAHDMFEARQIVAAAEKYGRMVQQGSQQRSKIGPTVVKQIDDGLIGDVYMARGLCFKFRNTIGKKPAEPVPAGVNYDLWTGPAQMRPFTQNRFHYNWHWFWDFGNGDLGNQGIHQLDMARWGLGVKWPTKITAMGGHFMFDDDQETPNTLTAVFEFEDGPPKKMLVFEVRHWTTNHEAGVGGARLGGDTIGTSFYGSKGYMSVGEEDSHQYQSWLGTGRQQTVGPASTDADAVSKYAHWENFISCVRSRKAQDLHAPIQEGAISTTLIHLANMSYRLGRTLHFDPVKYTCTGDTEANAMFKRDYRKPFVVPDKV